MISRSAGVMSMTKVGRGGGARQRKCVGSMRATLADPCAAPRAPTRRAIAVRARLAGKTAARAASRNADPDRSDRPVWKNSFRDIDRAVVPHAEERTAAGVRAKPRIDLDQRAR